MTQPDTLHDRIRAEIDRRLAVARAATPGPWEYNAGKAWFPDPTIPNRLRAGARMSDIPVLAQYAAISEDEFARARYGQEYVKAGDLGVATTGDTDHPQAMADARHIALHDPADAIRRYEGELEVLERHAPTDVDAYRYGITCKGCPNSAVNWPCFEIRSLAHRLGVSVDG